jgi:glycosyltransferase involved in cell wall biosynthesis
MNKDKKAVPSISVIVPVYNAEKTLRQCVDSILAQDFKDFELLLIDDGSKDGSPVICDEYAAKDTRVRAFHKENGGVSSARNVGLDHAKGEWITFVDSDDYITKGYFDGVIGRKEDLLIISYVWLINGNETSDNRLNGYHHISEETDIREFLNFFLTTMIFRGPVAKLYKKERLGEIRFDDSLKVGEDTCFVHHYLLNCHSFFCLHRGRYVVRLAEVDAEIKYKSTTDYAVHSLNRLHSSFDKLVKQRSINRSLFISYLVYYKMICRDDWKKKPSKWYRNDKVRWIYNYIWPYMLLNEKIKFQIIRLLSIVW